MQSMLGTRKLILSSAYYNNILSLQNLFQLSPTNFHYYLSEINSFHFTVRFYSVFLLIFIK